MIKGVNKQIIEINEAGNPYFEKVILFVRPECSEMSAEHIKGQAGQMVRTICAAPSRGRRLSAEVRRREARLRGIRRAVMAGLWIAAGAGLFALVEYLLMR